MSLAVLNVHYLSYCWVDFIERIFHSLFIHLPVDGILFSPQCLAIVDKVMTISVQIFMWARDFISLGNYLCVKGDKD